MIRFAVWVGVLVFVLVPIFIGALSDTDPGAHMPEGGVEGIPDVLLMAYVQAATRLEEDHPECTNMTWPVLAGIGKVESDHAAGSEISSSGDVSPKIIGPRLDGSGAGGNLTPHTDSDDGKWDGDTDYDRAVGPMQFIPTTWASHGASATGRGEGDPHNAFDATWSAAVYLCDNGADGVDFAEQADLESALFSYNRSRSYVNEVSGHIEEYTELAAQTVTERPIVGSGAGSEQGRAAAEWALEQVGLPYVWGGLGPEGFDCSGLTQQAWARAGVDIPRVTTDQVNVGTRVGLDELQPGDLLFYDTGGPGGSPAHVTMYVGDGDMVNAPRTGQDIRVEPVESEYYSPRFVAATRPG
ncbi:C40 family peptidase [Nocardiopsis salina]|uniref:C40 family peptidase n=1 Tax=Nocardiopsis salina TaxID=245836 RepID=UPI000345C2A0|nr:bifunctional lytic transglycosylase/C40 family peptidase [Nocardiopsis salina]